MKRGLYISGGAHAALILWMLIGGVFSAEPPEVTVAEVTVISEAQFAALTQPEPAPVRPTPRPRPQPAPEPAPEPTPEPAPLPDPEPQPDPQPEPAPAPVPEPEPQPAPEPQPDPQPVPEPEPEPVPPAPLPEPEPIPEPIPEPPVIAPPQVAAPVSSLRPQPRPARIVAPTPQAPPEPESVVAEETRQAASPDAESPDIADESQDQTAPEETTTEIVTEAEQAAGTGAPTTSRRPQARHRRAAQEPQDQTTTAEPDADTPPEPTVDPAPEPEPEPEPVDPLQAALAEALSADAAPDSGGAQLTGEEMDRFRVSVQNCWIVDVGSRAADVAVTLAFDMTRDGKPVVGSIRQVAATGADAQAAEIAFQSARRALILCQGPDGYGLPAEKYDQWKQIEMTFNPADMRLR